MEEFLGMFPTSVQETKNDKVGFFIRFSVSRNKWVAGYGIERSKRYEHNKEQAGLGDTIKEALDDLTIKIRNYSYSDKYNGK